MRCLLSCRSLVAAAAFACAACCACAGSARAQVVLNFENLSPPDAGYGSRFQGYVVSQNGFSVTDAVHGNGLWSVGPQNNFGYNYTGSLALFESPTGGATTLTQDNGKPFNLDSMDLANLGPQRLIPGGVVVTVIGTYTDGSTITQTYSHGANDNLETVVFGPSFSNVVSVIWGQGFPNAQFDNIRVTPVPEPGSVALLMGLGGVAAGFAVRRGRLARKSA